MTIGELSSKTGFPSSTIRYYEKLGVLPKPRRASGQRRYQPEALDHLAVLRLAQSCGFNLHEVKLLLQGFGTAAKPSERWHILAERKRIELDEQMKKLALMRKFVDRVSACECSDLAECASACGTGGSGFHSNPSVSREQVRLRRNS
jgi:MerR family transcriptional regulator, redox-sensitive transcriptional activator SoxR